MTTDAPPSPPAATPAAGATSHGSSFAYLPGIDGLRALAVLAVIVYHGDLGILGGGFLGVEVFFVISGYLITSLLLSETDRTGGVSLGHFWMRRARRLLPALFALLIGVVIISATIAPDMWDRLRGDVTAAVLYVSNWWQVFHQESYFQAAGRPPLLRHLWSLAVEEQFYVIWPLVFAFIAVKFKRGGLALAAIGVALASAVWMAVLYDPATDASRVYYGTDTRLSGLLLGVALAALWPAHQFRKERAARSAGLTLDVLGVVGLAVLAWGFIRVNEFDPFIYRGGFVLFDLATIAVIAVVVHPSARLGRVLGVAPLVWIGLRSYGLYLWHWPVFQITRPDLDVPMHGWALFAFRMTITVALTELSFRFIEQPVRTGSLGRNVRALRKPTEPGQRAAAAKFLGYPLLVLALTVALMAFGPLRHDDGEAQTLASTTAAEINDSVTTSTLPPTTTTIPPTVPPTTAAVSPAVVPETAPAPTAPPPTAAPPVATPPQLPPIAGGVTAIGDSVMIGAVEEMRYTLPGVNINAKVSRQFDEALTVATLLRDAVPTQMQGTLVVHLGTNGWFTAAQFDQMMKIAGDRHVLFLTAKAARSWEGITNQRLHEGVERWPNAQLLDWHAIGSGHPEYFTKDGIHLNPTGQRAYAALIREALQ